MTVIVKIKGAVGASRLRSFFCAECAAYFDAFTKYVGVDEACRELDYVPDLEPRAHSCGALCQAKNRPDAGSPGIITNGRGVRSSGESLDPGVRRLAAMSFGKCVETGKYADMPDGRREPVMRPVQTEGELDGQLLVHGKRRGTVAEANARFEEMKAERGKPEPLAPRAPSDAQVYAVKNRREKFRSDFDNGAIPKREIPADVAPLLPKV